MTFKIIAAVVISNCLFGLFWKKSVQNGGNIVVFFVILAVTYLVAALVMHVFGIQSAERSVRVMKGWATIQMVLSAAAATFLYVLLSNLWVTQDISRLMPLVNIGSIAVFSLIGLIVFQEKFSWDKIMGLILALASLFFLNYRQIVKGWN